DQPQPLLTAVSRSGRGPEPSLTRPPRILERLIRRELALPRWPGIALAAHGIRAGSRVSVDPALPLLPRSKRRACDIRRAGGTVGRGCGRWPCLLLRPLLGEPCVLL